MYNSAVFIGEPLPFKHKIKIYPPKVKDVVTNVNFPIFQRMLTVSDDDIKEDILKNQEGITNYPTPFEFLLINCYREKSLRTITTEAFRFFLHEDVHFFFEEKMIVVGDYKDILPTLTSFDDLVTIKEEDYFDFQNAIRLVCGMKELKPPEPPNPNEDPRIAAIKAKARARDRVKAKQKGKDGISLETSLTAICCMGLGITPLNIGEMSYAAIGPIMNMMQEKEKYDIDIRSLLAGADSKKIKPKYWIRNPDKD